MSASLLSEKTMSRASKITLGVSVTFTASIIAYVHSWQKKEKERLRQGVIFDLERQEQKIKNLADKEKQTQSAETHQEQEWQMSEQENRQKMTANSG